MRIKCFYINGYIYRRETSPADKERDPSRSKIVLAYNMDKFTGFWISVIH
jgi:hypothetical protein